MPTRFFRLIFWVMKLNYVYGAGTMEQRWQASLAYLGRLFHYEGVS